MFDKSPEEIQELLGVLPGKGDLSKSSYKVYTIDDSLSGTSSGSTSKKTTDTTSTDSSTFGAVSATPSSYDWRTYGVVTPIKDQGQCGSCWAFSATAFLESEYIRRKKATNTINFSEQYLMNCDTSSYRCNGGFPFNAASKGISTGMPLESTYPYNIASYSTTMCASPLISATFSTSGSVISYQRTTKVSDATLIGYLLQRPIMIGVNANDWSYYYPNATATVDQKTLYCSTGNSNGTTINHAVLLVGYTAKAWLIKNSWGTWWGDQGYVWVTRNQTRSCNIGNYYGTLNTTIV